MQRQPSLPEPFRNTAEALYRKYAAQLMALEKVATAPTDKKLIDACKAKMMEVATLLWGDAGVVQ